MGAKTPDGSSGLSVTALYTAGVWVWAGVEDAERFAGKDTQAVFRWVNRVLALARVFRPGLPSLRHSLAHRHKIIDHLAGLDPSRMLLEVGVGLSPRPLTFARLGRRCLEVDLPEMMRARRARLAACGLGEDAGSALAGERLSIEGDLLDLKSFVGQIDRPTTVVVEGVFPYFSSAQREEIWSGLCACLGRHGGRLIFDLTPDDEEPRPGGVGRLLAWMLRRFTRGRSFVSGHRSREAIVTALRDAGFTQVAIFDQASPPSGSSLMPVSQPTKTVVFEARVEKGGRGGSVRGDLLARGVQERGT